MRIYYYSPTNDNRPSWGLGVIHYHVDILRRNGLEAYIVYDQENFKLSWLDLKVPTLSMRQFLASKPTSEDWLVVPEVAADKAELQVPCSTVLFAQAGFFIYEGLRSGKSPEELNYKGVMYIMPHLQKVLAMITNLPLYEVPPFVAPYYFEQRQPTERKKRILLYPKFDNREYYILKRLLERHLGISDRSRLQRFLKPSGWELEELKGLTHKEVAKKMANSTFFVSLNTTEALNTSVPEAMATGCIPLCYEAYGPKDYLINGFNSFVFENHDIFGLAQKIIDLVQNFPTVEHTLLAHRENARNTAMKYTVENAEKPLLRMFTDLVR